MEGTALLRYLRSRAGPGLRPMTLAALAAKMHTSVPMLSVFEIGKVEASERFIARYARALGTEERLVRLAYLQAVCQHAKNRLKWAQIEIRRLSKKGLAPYHK